MSQTDEMSFEGVYQSDEEALRKEKSPKPEKKAPAVTLYSKVKAAPVRSVSQLVSLTLTAMQDRQAVWDRYRRKYRRGLQYLRVQSDGSPTYFTNYLYATIESVKSNLTRNLPTILASPRGQRDDVAADLMSRVLSDSLERGGLKVALREIVHHGLIATMAHFKIAYSALTDNLEICAIPPDDLLIDPKATSLANARWVIHRRHNVPADELYATYNVLPSKSQDRVSELGGVNALNDRQGLYITEGELSDAINVSQTFDTYEAWIRCWEKNRENDWYVVTVAGDTVLKAEFSVYDHNKLPFVTWIAAEDFSGDNIYYRGVGYIEEIEPLQDRADSVDTKLHKNISLLSNRQRFVSSNAGLNVNTMDNTAGRTYKVNGDPSKAVYYDAPPQMSDSVYNYRDRTEMLIQTVSGVYDVTMGRRPTGITAGRAIDSLKDSAETRLASILDTLAEALGELGGLGMQIILQFFDGERIIRSTDGDKEKDFLVVADYPPELQPQPAVQEDSFGFPMLDENEEPITVETDEEPEVTPDLLQAREEWKAQTGVAIVLSDITYTWDIKVDTDSALPATRAERGQVAADLFRLGAIDREAVLTSLDFPGRHKILQRLAAEATGKNAGDPVVDPTQGVIDQVMQVLQQMGMPAEMLDQVMQAVQGGQPQQPQHGGNYPPQMM